MKNPGFKIIQTTVVKQIQTTFKLSIIAQLGTQKANGNCCWGQMDCGHLRLELCTSGRCPYHA
jgi:hypothetical protein